jgi:hypothetical protein
MLIVRLARVQQGARVVNLSGLVHAVQVQALRRGHPIKRGAQTAIYCI